MLKIRLIPILTFNGISLVKTKQFSQMRIVGNPIQAARVYNSRNVDELVFVDIMATQKNRQMNLNLVKRVIDECFMPVTIGGGIQTHEQINALLGIGADKVLIKSKALNDTEFIKKAVEYYGSQCISIAADVIVRNGEYQIYTNIRENLSLNDFIQEMNQLKVGEIIVNAVDRDGMMQGFDKELYTQVASLSSIPLVAVGGAGQPKDFSELVASGFKGGIAAASIFHYTQYTPRDVKLELMQHNFPVRI